MRKMWLRAAAGLMALMLCTAQALAEEILPADDLPDHELEIREEIGEQPEDELPGNDESGEMPGEEPEEPDDDPDEDAEQEPVWTLIGIGPVNILRVMGSNAAAQAMWTADETCQGGIDWECEGAVSYRYLFDGRQEGVGGGIALDGSEVRSGEHSLVITATMWDGSVQQMNVAIRLMGLGGLGNMTGAGAAALAGTGASDAASAQAALGGMDASTLAAMAAAMATGGGRSVPGTQSGGKTVNVIPGRAFASDHAEGTGELTDYTTVDPSLMTQDQQMKLSVDGQELDIAISNGGAFKAELKEWAIELVPEERDKDAVWIASQTAMNTLSSSGVYEMIFWLNGRKKIIPTNISFTGRTYAKLRSAGYTAQDFLIEVGIYGMTVRVDGEAYEYKDGELNRI